MNGTGEGTSKLSSEERDALEKAAYQKGYNDYKRGMVGKSASSVIQPSSMPPAGFEKAYNDGWRMASQQTIADAETKAHRGEGLGYLQLGGVLIVAGVIMAGAAFYYKLDRFGPFPFLLVAGGLMSLVTGIYKFFSRRSND